MVTSRRLMTSRTIITIIRRSSPDLHAFAPDDREARHQAVGVVVPAEAQQVEQAAILRLAAGERPQPSVRHDQVAVEVSPEALAPPALGLAEAEVDVGGDADEPEHARIEPELLLQHVATAIEQGLLDRDPRQRATTRQPQAREQPR